jgi:hypothetical protein
MSLIIKKNTTFKIPRTGSGAPSGIPVASTSSVIITNSLSNGQNWNGTYIFNSENNRYELDFGSSLQYLYWYSNSNQWSISWTNFDNGYDEYNETPSQNQNYIPTAGWQFTITAA